MVDDNDGVFDGTVLPQDRPLSEVWTPKEWPDFAEYCRFYPGQLVVMSGHAGSGKSTFLFNLLMQFAVLDGLTSLFFVPENQPHFIASLRKMWRWSPEGVNYYLKNQVRILDARPEHWGDEPQDVIALLNKLDRAIAKYKPSFVMIDPWNELEVCRDRNELMTDYIGKCLRWLKQLARERQVCVIIVAHPTKASVERDWPLLSDIEGSMHWFNKCDNGLTIRRYEDRDMCAVAVQKVRQSPEAGKRGLVEFFVDSGSGIFMPTGCGGTVVPFGSTTGRNPRARR